MKEQGWDWDKMKEENHEKWEQMKQEWEDKANEWLKEEGWDWEDMKEKKMWDEMKDELKAKTKDWFEEEGWEWPAAWETDEEWDLEDEDRPMFGQDEAMVKMAVSNLFEADDLMEMTEENSTLLLDADEPHYLKAKGNVTTGYTWLIDHSTCGDALSILDQYISPAMMGNEQMMGASGETLFTLQASGSVDCQVQFAYARPWEFSWEEPSNDVQIISISVSADM